VVPDRHVTVSVSRDQACGIFDFCIAISRCVGVTREYHSVLQTSERIYMAWMSCIFDTFEGLHAINERVSTIASHVQTPHVPALLLHLQRHLLACDARNDNEIMNEERHTRDRLVEIPIALESISTVI
jgi:hypothetical protein